MGVRPPTEDQMPPPESNPRELPEDSEFFVQAEFPITSDHRDLFAHNLGDDLAVERVLVVGDRRAV